MFGQATLFKFGWVVFTISTLLSGFATPSQHGNDLVAYRAVMGLGAAFLFTNSNALIVNDFAPFNQGECYFPATVALNAIAPFVYYDARVTT